MFIWKIVLLLLNNIRINCFAYFCPNLYSLKDGKKRMHLTCCDNVLVSKGKFIHSHSRQVHGQVPRPFPKDWERKHQEILNTCFSASFANFGWEMLQVDMESLDFICLENTQLLYLKYHSIPEKNYILNKTIKKTSWARCRNHFTSKFGIT